MVRTVSDMFLWLFSCTGIVVMVLLWNDDHWDEVRDAVKPEQISIPVTWAGRDAISSAWSGSSENFVSKVRIHYNRKRRHLVFWSSLATTACWVGYDPLEPTLFVQRLHWHQVQMPTVDPEWRCYTRDVQGWPRLCLPISKFMAHGFFPLQMPCMWNHEGGGFGVNGRMGAARSILPVEGVNAIGSYLKLLINALIIVAAKIRRWGIGLYAYGSVLFPIYLHEITGEEFLFHKYGRGRWTSPLETIESCWPNEAGFLRCMDGSQYQHVFMDEYTYGGMYQEIAGYDWWDEWRVTEQP